MLIPSFQFVAEELIIFFVKWLFAALFFRGGEKVLILRFKVKIRNSLTFRECC